MERDGVFAVGLKTGRFIARETRGRARKFLRFKCSFFRVFRVFSGKNYMNNSPENNLAIKVENLVKRYKNGTEATRGIDFDIRKGEAVAILGANGAGKTSFLRQLTTELKPTSGSVKIFGVDAVKNANRAKTLMGVTPQEAGVFETLTVTEHLELFGKFKGLDKQTARSQAFEIIKNLELENEMKRKVGELSGGQKRRILIGLAFLGNPPLLILDEPTTGLDPVSRRAVWHLLKKINKNGATVVLSTHYLEEAEFLSDRIAFIKSGKIVADGSLTELSAGFPNKYRVNYLNGNGQIPAPHVEFFADFSAAQKFIQTNKFDEYQLSKSSLEDVYFSVIGEHFEAEKNGFEPLSK